MKYKGKVGYKLFLVDEFKTSKQCYNCGNNEAICEKLIHQDHGRKIQKFCVKCTTCNTIFNRDLNSVLNIHYICKYALDNESRPEYLRR